MKNLKHQILIMLLITIGFSFQSCLKDKVVSLENNKEVNSMEDLVVPQDFDWKTS